MHLTCPHCQHAVEFQSERPRFCSFCGESLSVITSSPELEAPTMTVAREPEGSTLLRADTAAEGRVFQPGDVIGGYRLERKIGAGAMGSVFEAEATGSGQRVAVKLIAPEFAMSSSAVERFRLEGKLASTIAHPRCVFVYAAEEEAGQPYIVMELMPGTTLGTVVAERGALPPREAIQMILDVIDGLEEAHRLGVIHRDVKPSNCFVDENGHVKVGDFGLAKSVQEEGALTRTGTFVGTVLFASPEQIKRQTLDAQSDVYSVCATLYYLLTGRAPFGGTGDALSAATRIVTEDAPSMLSLRPDLPPGLDRVVLKGLERDKGRRWANLQSLREALLRFLPGQLSFGGLGSRFVAHVVDMVVRLLLAFPVGLLSVEGFATNKFSQTYGATVLVWATQLLATLAIWCLYFALMEGIWGFSVGKLLLGLRVCRADGVEPPGFLRALLRSFASFSLINATSWAPLLVMVIGLLFVEPGRPVQEAVVVMLLVLLAEIVGFVGGIGIACSTMRTRNGYRGLHEIASGTRVLELTPRRRRRRAFNGAPFNVQIFCPQEMPAKIGRFEVEGAVRWHAEDRALLGRDPSLDRAVWITMRTHQSTEGERARQHVTRPTRIRWVASGSDNGWQWDAYIAPGGMPLPVAIAQDGCLPWGDAAPLLEQLTDELTAACEDGSLPELLSIHQVWIDKSGRVQLLGTPLTGDETNVVSPDVARHAEENPEQRSMHLLRDAAARLLEGEARAAEKRRGIRAPMPRYAAACLNRLFPGPRCCGGLREFRDELRRVLDRPAEVTHARRFAHLCVLGLLMLVSVGWLLLFCISAPYYIELFALKAHSERLLTEFAIAERHDLAVATTQPDPGLRLVGLAQYAGDERLLDALEEHVAAKRDHFHARVESSFLLRNQLRMQEKALIGTIRPRVRPNIRDEVREELNSPAPESLVTAVTQWVCLLAGPSIWMIWAFITRGGLSFRLLRLELVRADGRKAARWQCLLRALAFWSLPAAFWGAAIMVDQHYWSHWYDPEFRRIYSWMPTVSWVAWGAGLVVLVAYFVGAMWRPQRSWHDRIAGTWLMPR